jgi:hypothetical protein
MRVIVDFDRARAVFDTLMATLAAGGYPYNTKRGQVPHIPENLPKNGFASDIHKAGYFFALCYYMRGGIRSDRATKAMTGIYEQHPEYFVPAVAAELDPHEIRRALMSVRLGYSKLHNTPRFWVENSRRIVERWQGDPRRIFDGVTAYEEAAARIRNKKTGRRTPPKSPYDGFLGFQEKMVSMLIYFFMDVELLDRWHFPLPIDFQVLRVLFEHEIVRVEGQANGNHYLPETLAEARALTLWYAQEHNMNPLRFCDALWCFSRAMCEQNPGNKTNGRVRYAQGMGRRTPIRSAPVTWSQSQVRAYERSCGRCPVESTCRWNIPSGPYYVQGKLVVRGPRERSPQKRLFD